MLEALNKLFAETIGLSAEIWLYILLAVVGLSFIVTLIVGLLTGNLKAIKSVMKTAIATPQAAVAALKKLPVSVKAQYKNARMSNLKPSVLVTESVCVGEPYKHSLISKLWLITFIATVICAGIGYVSAPFAEDGGLGMFISPLMILIVGGLLTLVGGIVGKCVYSGAVKTYAKFVPVLDGDVTVGAGPQQPAYSEPQATAYAGQAQQEYTAEPQAEYVSAQEQVTPEPVYAAEPQAQPIYEEPPVMATPQESDEEIRRRAREEALARARAAQAEQQAQAAQAARAYAQAQAQTASSSSSADSVIAQIEKIDREGAPRETMREVATLLQKERAKPENKTPEQQKRLNEALSKLLKAMSAASKK